MAFELSIVTPEGVRFQEPVDHVVLPGAEGAFGVLTGHVRFLAPLGIGEAAVTTKGKTLFAALSDGFAEVTQDHVTVMVDTCEFAEDIDLARAQRARADAEAALAAAKSAAHESELFARQEAALKRAILRIKLATDAGRH
ncbi:F-type H+-transporting ATPase subunit epsilon [Myxococcaceae bacterium]|jgi:F-type H+-transporting ATPase subunit epsilon|nr:F-type H+-transporting ATPase subunit epsilon [Myxococcaceae bacterium]